MGLRIPKKRSLVSILTAGVISVFGAGCGSSDSVVVVENPNNAPNILTSNLGTAIEGYDINKVITGFDADSDPLTYSIVSGPAGASITPIDSTSTTFNWTPTHDQADVSQSITIRASDGITATDKTYNVTPENRSVIDGMVYEIGTGSSPFPLEGITVNVGSQSTTTNASGYWEITDLVDGTHSVMFKDSLGTYETYKAGDLVADKNRETIGKNSNLEKRLFLQADRQFIKDTIRLDGETRKWKTKPKFRIYTVEDEYGGGVGQPKIDLVKGIIKTELSEFGSDTYDFTDLDIERVNTKVDSSGPVEEGYVYVFWDDSIVGGGNFSWENGNEITSSYARADTSRVKTTWLQELTECLIGTGETLDSNYINSSLHDPSIANDYSTDDIKLSEAMYHRFAKRAAGNKDLGTTDNHDVNPSGTVVESY